MPATRISFDAADSTTATTTTLVIGKKKVLADLPDLSAVLNLDTNVPSDMTKALLESISGDSGAASTLLPSSGSTFQRLTLATIPEKVSRNNHPWSVHTATDLVAKHLSPSKKSASRVVFVGDDAVTYKGALTSAIAKAFPLYSRKTKQDNGNDNVDKHHTIHVAFCNAQGQPMEDDTANQAALAAAEGVQMAARLMDMTPEELTTDAYSQECRAIVDGLEGVTMTEMVGEELRDKGYGGLWGVGKAATCPPRLIIMEYTPPTQSTADDSKTIALVGKGIVYDTGGLALKPKVGMCGMKHDMGGSAALLGGFVSAVKSGSCRHKVTLLLCLAENAIGPLAVRNDDILTLYSGKTVEINNSDAEGRLVLGDGVAHATKHIAGLDLVVNMATLTGAQSVCTGKKHASILANTPALEQRAIQAGLASGDLVFPVLYAPELLQPEFASKVADMKNSVKDRSNAQASCAGHFIESHLDPDYTGEWLHVDMAGPGSKDERGTGYGVGLVLSLLDIPGF